LVLGLVMVVLLGGGAFAFYKADPFNLFRAGPQAAEALPSDAVFYFGVDLDPSAEQKINALRFLQKFPAFGDATGLKDARDDVRKTIIEDALESANCPDVTYKDDIGPWIGNKFGGAVVLRHGEPQFMFVIETSDQDAARAGLEAVGKCAGEQPGVASVGDYVLLAETQRLADGFAADAKDASLADSDRFSADMDAIGDLGLATMWVDIDGAVKATEADTFFGPQEELLAATFQRAAATFRFEADSAEIIGVAYGDMPTTDAGDNQIVDLPDSTAYAMSLAGGERSLLDIWDTVLSAAEADGVDVEQEIADFETQTGLTIPEDLATLLGRNVLVAIDSEGLTAEAIEEEDPTKVNGGVRMTNDPEKLNAIYDKVVGLMQEEMGQVPFSKKDAGDGIVIASNDAYADKLASLDGNLGDTDAFKSVIDDAADKQFVTFFNWDSVEDEIVKAMQSQGEDPETIDNLRPLQAIGFAVDVEGDYATTSFQVSVN
jgi:hypothetical protein